MANKLVALKVNKKLNSNRQFLYDHVHLIRFSFCENKNEMNEEIKLLIISI